MSDLIHSDEDLKKIYLKESGTEEHSEYFIRKYHEIYTDVEDDESFLEDGEILKDAVLKYSIEFYLKKFLELIQNGHCLEWADALAEHIESEEERTIGETYLKLKKNDPELAKEQLEVYCKSLGKDDPLFVEYYIYLLDEHEPYDAVKYSGNYVKAYREKIAEGKSETFSKAYADIMSIEEYSKDWCFVQAEAFERAITEGRSQLYAGVYSEKYVQMIFNNYNSYFKVEKDDYYDYLHQKVLDEVGDIK